MSSVKKRKTREKKEKEKEKKHTHTLILTQHTDGMLHSHKKKILI